MIGLGICGLISLVGYVRACCVDDEESASTMFICLHVYIVGLCVLGGLK